MSGIFLIERPNKVGDGTHGAVLVQVKPRTNFDVMLRYRNLEIDLDRFATLFKLLKKVGREQFPWECLKVPGISGEEIQAVKAIETRMFFESRLLGLAGVNPDPQVDLIMKSVAGLLTS